MRILYLVHRVPFPPDKGDKIRSFAWLDRLAARHDIDLVALVDDPRDLAHESILRERCRSVALVPTGGLGSRFAALSRLLCGGPLSLGIFHRPAAQEAVNRILARGETDVVLAFSSTMAEYVLDRSELPRVMDMVDVDSAKFAAYAARGRFPRLTVHGIEGRRLAVYEEKVARAFDATVLCTEPEAELLRRRVPGAAIHAIHNGIDLPDEPIDDRKRSGSRMIFVGAMDYLANVDAVEFAAREILPLVRREVADAEFHIVGRGPTAAVRALAALPGVVVHGAVPSIADHLRGASLSLVPLRIAQGIQNKVLEAMAWSLPVVTTTRVRSSLGAEEGRHLMSRDDAAGLASAAVALLRDRAAAAAMGAASRRFVAERFAWEPEVLKLEALLERAVGGRREP